MIRWLCASSLLGAVWGAALVLWRMPAAPPPEPPIEVVSSGETFTGAPMTDRERWAVDILAGVQNTQPSAEIVGFLVEWTCAEDSGGGALARNNVLNTTQTGFNETQTINGDGVKGYATYEDGLAATLQTLSYSSYTEIVAGLQTNDPQRAFNGLIASPWAGSHYGGGADWPHGGC